MDRPSNIITPLKYYEIFLEKRLQYYGTMTLLGVELKFVKRMIYYNIITAIILYYILHRVVVLVSLLVVPLAWPHCCGLMIHTKKAIMKVDPAKKSTSCIGIYTVTLDIKYV